ncbi:MAG: CHASE2 domain-containing protein, partial [Limisphaerales bacterium]
LALGVIVVVCLIQSFRFWTEEDDPFERLEWVTYDWRAKAAEARQPPVATNLAFLAITDETIREIAEGVRINLPPTGLYWPRSLYGRVVRELNLQGAQAIAFDVIFSDRRVDHDADLTNVVSITEVDAAGVTNQVLRTNVTFIRSDGLFRDQMSMGSNVVIGSTPNLLPHPIFRDVAHLGDISSYPDEDGVLRRTRPFSTYRVWEGNIIQQVKMGKGLNLDSAEIRPNSIVFRDNTQTNSYRLVLNQDGQFDLRQMTADLLKGYEDQVTEEMRWCPPYVEFREWHMGITMAAIDLGLDLKNAKIGEEEIFIPGTNGVDRTIPIDHRGLMHINWAVRYGHTNLLLDTMEFQLFNDTERELGYAVPEDESSKFQNRLVFIGSAATGNELTDQGPTPLGLDSFLISKHWNVANSVIMNQFVVRSGLAFELMIVVILGVLTAMASILLRPPWSTITIVLIGALWVWIAFAHFLETLEWIPIFVPVVGAVLWNHAMMVAYQVVFEGQERRRIKGVFSKLVSPNVVNELLGQKDLHLGGQRRRITVFFSDVRGFTTMTDEMQKYADDFVKNHGLEGAEAEAFRDAVAQDTLETVNTYLAAIADQIKKHNGTLDKYIGDCVMAFWGAPTPNPAHAVSCVRSAIDAQLAMYALNVQRASENATIELENERRVERGEAPRPLKRLLVMGSGVNTGEAIVGLMGSEAHIINFTVFGRAVNLASRLEHVSGRSRVIIGEATYRDLETHAPELAETCLEKDSVHVKGIEDAVRIWEVPWRIYLADEMNAGRLDPAQDPEPEESLKATTPAPAESKENEAKRLAEAARVTAMLTRRDFGIAEPKKSESKKAEPTKEVGSIDESDVIPDKENPSRDDILKATAFLARKRFREAAENEAAKEDDPSDSKEQN